MGGPRQASWSQMGVTVKRSQSLASGSSLLLLEVRGREGSQFIMQDLARLAVLAAGKQLVQVKGYEWA